MDRNNIHTANGYLSAPAIPPAQTVRLYVHNGRVSKLRPYSRTSRLRVDVVFNPRDFLVVLLGSLGYATDCIASQVSLSPGQVLYRLKKGGVSRKDYRNGQSPVARLVLQRSAEAARPLLEKQLMARRLPKTAAA